MSLNKAYVKKGGKIFEIPVNELVRHRASGHDHATKAEFLAQQQKAAEAAEATQGQTKAGGGPAGGNGGNQPQTGMEKLKGFFGKFFSTEGDSLDKATDAELLEAAGDLEIEGCAQMARPDLIEAIRETREARIPLEDKTAKELKEIARELKIPNYGSMTKDDLLVAIPEARQKQTGNG